MSTGEHDPQFPDPNYPPPNVPPQGFPPPPPGGYSGYPPPAQYGGQTVVPGTLGVRFLARILDGVVVALLAGALTSIFGFGSETVLGVPSYTLAVGLFSGLLTFAYFVGFEVWKGWTPAKKLLGLEVRGVGGAPKPDLRQSAVRNLFTLLSLVPCLGWILAPVAYIVIAVTINSSPTKQGKHDELAGGTQVVKTG